MEAGEHFNLLKASRNEIFGKDEVWRSLQIYAPSIPVPALGVSFNFITNKRNKLTEKRGEEK